MSAWFLAELPAWGPWLVALVTLMASMAMPVPASLVMTTAAALAATGDLSTWQISVAGWGGSVLGDLGAFLVARSARDPVRAWVGRSRRQARAMERALLRLERGAVATVFLSRWLFSPLCPFVSLAAGMSGLSLTRFVAPVLAGQALWTGLYVALGTAFAGSLTAATDMIGSVLGLAAAGVVTYVLGAMLIRRLRHR